MDRGYNPAQMWIDYADQGVRLVVRYNPHGLRLYDSEGQKIEVDAILRKTSATELCPPVQVRSPKKEFIQGYLHARRRQPRQPARKGAPSSNGP